MTGADGREEAPARWPGRLSPCEALLGHFQVGLGQLFHVDILKGDNADIFNKTGWAVHVPDPGVLHLHVEEDVAVLRRPYLEVHRVRQVEPSLRLHHVGEQPDDIAVLAVKLQLHLGFILLEILCAHRVLPVAPVPLSASLGNADPPPIVAHLSTVTNEKRWCAHGPWSASARRCRGVTYPLCSAKPYSGYAVSSDTIIRSRVTLATIEAAATQAMTWSPFHTASDGAGRPGTGNPSVRMYPGSEGSAATARRIPAMLLRCSPRVSISVDEITTTPTEAVAMIRSYSTSRAAGVSALESPSPGSARPSTPAATTSGPAHAPRPASSTPATGVSPRRASARS